MEHCRRAVANNKLAVLHVSLEPVTGVWSVIRELIRAQVASGHYRSVAIGVIASHKWPVTYSDALKQLGVKCYHFPTLHTFGTAKFLWQRLSPPPIGAWADDLLKRSGAGSAVVHFHNAWMSGVFLPLKAKHASRILPVITFHGVNPVLQQKPVRRWLHQYMARRIKRYGASLTSVTAASLPLAQELFGFGADEFAVVANGVEAVKGEMAAQWTGAGDFVMGYLGNIEPQKGWRIVVEAVLKVRSAGRRVRLVLGGAGPEADELRILARNNPDAIDYRGFASAPRQNIMPKVHALTLMSEYEGLPMVFVEAVSVGLPIVATAVGGVPEIVQDGVTGLLISRSVEGLAAAIARLYDNPNITQGMSRAAQALHGERFELSKVVDQYHSVYTNGARRHQGQGTM